MATERTLAEVLQQDYNIVIAENGYLKLATDDGTAETILDKDGIRMKKDATQFNDLQFAINSVNVDTANSPIWKRYVGATNTSTAKYLNITNKTFEDTYGYFPKTIHNDLDDTKNPEWSLSFWFKADSRGSGIIALEANLVIDIDFQDRLRFRFGNEPAETLLTKITYDKWYHIVIRTKTDGNKKKVQAFVNNSRRSNSAYSPLLNTWVDNWLLGARGEHNSAWWHGDVAIEEMIMYNFYISNDQRKELWNNGIGRGSLITTNGSTPVNINTVLFWYHFNNEDGPITLVDDSNFTNDGIMYGSHWNWEVGGIGVGNNANSGLKCLYFETDEEQEIEFTGQVPHSIYHGSGLPFHIHVNLPTAVASASDIPVFGLEYYIDNIFEDLGVTTTIYSTGFLNDEYSDNKHIILLFSIIAKSQANADISKSAMIHGRMFRTNDGYNNGVFMKQFDSHVKQGDLGTNNEWM